MFSSWLAHQRDVYFKNASSIKDYRIEFRSKSAGIRWFLYMCAVVALSTIVYGANNVGGSKSPAELQQSLSVFYYVLIGILQVVVMFVAPIIMGSAVSAERERKSLELLLVGPVSPKYFLVGAFMSALRKLFMILILALPLASVAIVLGGSTWAEVAETFGLLFIQGIFYMGLSIPSALRSNSQIVVALSAYFVFGLIVIPLWIFTSIFVLPMLFMGMGGVDVPFYLGLLPWGFLFAVGQKMTLFGLDIPLWVMCLVTALICARLFLTGGGSVMSRYPSKETISLRVQLLVFFGLLGLAVGVAVTSAIGAFGPGTAGGPGMSSGPGLPPALNVNALLTVPMLAAPILAAYVSSFSFLESEQYIAEKWWRPSQLLLGKPSGGLAFVLVSMLLLVVPGMVYGGLNGAFNWLDYVTITVMSCALGFLYWGITWFASSASRTAMTSRTMSLIMNLSLLFGVNFIFYLVYGIISVYYALSTGPGTMFGTFNMNDLNFMNPYGTDVRYILMKAFVLVVIGLAAGSIAEKRRKEKALQLGYRS